MKHLQQLLQQVGEMCASE